MTVNDTIYLDCPEEPNLTDTMYVEVEPEEEDTREAPRDTT